MTNIQEPKEKNINYLEGLLRSIWLRSENLDDENVIEQLDINK